MTTMAMKHSYVSAKWVFRHFKNMMGPNEQAAIAWLNNNNVNYVIEIARDPAEPIVFSNDGEDGVLDMVDDRFLFHIEDEKVAFLFRMSCDAVTVRKEP